jgi:hypothetical protein
MSAPRQVLQVCKVLHRPRPAGPLCLGRTFERGVVNVTISKNVTIFELDEHVRRRPTLRGA